MGVAAMGVATGKEGGTESGCARNGCQWQPRLAHARARALFEFVVHTMNAMPGAMQFSRGWTSVVVPIAMLAAE